MLSQYRRLGTHKQAIPHRKTDQVILILYILDTSCVMEEIPFDESMGKHSLIVYLCLQLGELYFAWIRQQWTRFNFVRNFSEYILYTNCTIIFIVTITFMCLVLLACCISGSRYTTTLSC
jgi:hypothetical protein